MITDLNNTEIICFDSLSNDPKNLEVNPNDFILKYVEQGLIKAHVDPNKIHRVVFHYHDSQSVSKVTTVFRKTKIKVIKAKKLTLGLLKSDKLLAIVMYELQDKLHLFVDRSMVDVFVRMATCEDLSKFDGKIHLKCHTNLFSYILKRLEVYFTALNPTTIEKTGIFISNLENPITANCLYNSTIDNKQMIIIIDNILEKMG